MRWIVAVTVTGVAVCACSDDGGEVVPGPTVSGIISLVTPPADATLVNERPTRIEKLLRSGGLWAQVTVNDCELLKGVAVSQRHEATAVKVTVVSVHRGDNEGCADVGYPRVVQLPEDQIGSASMVIDEVSGANLPVPR